MSCLGLPTKLSRALGCCCVCRTGDGFVKTAHKPANRHEAFSPFTYLLVEGILFGVAEFFLLAITL